MKNIIPITDLQSQAAQILNDLSDNEPIVITQRGRASAVLLSARHYAQIEKDLQLLDDLELLQMVEEAKQDVQSGHTISHEDVKNALISQNNDSSRMDIASLSHFGKIAAGGRF